MSPVYRTQCKTFAVARDISGIRADVSIGDAHLYPPFSLRVVKQHRTQAMQDFRDIVAGEVRRARRMGVM